MVNKTFSYFTLLLFLILLLAMPPQKGGAQSTPGGFVPDIPAQAAELTVAGLASTSQLESGIATTLPTGIYTALLSGLNNGAGIGLVEVYDRGAP